MLLKVNEPNGIQVLIKVNFQSYIIFHLGTKTYFFSK